MVFFSRNVNDGIARHLGQLLGITITDYLGQYLRVPIVHGRITKETDKSIVKMMSSRSDDIGPVKGFLWLVD